MRINKKTLDIKIKNSILSNPYLRVLTGLIIVIVIMTSNVVAVLASGGEMGYSGGISEGENLPKTIEKYVEPTTNNNRNYQYKEVVFISGEPIVFEGTIQVTNNNEGIEENASGTYTERYSIDATNLENEATLERTLQFTTSYRVIDGQFKKQIVRDSTVTNWNETIDINGVTYELNEDLSTYSKSSVEDITPGVSYSSTSVSYNAEYTSSDDERVIINSEGSIYGYSQPWSKVETQTFNQNIIAKDWQMDVEIKPYLEAKKTIYYDQTEPFPISFGGTYNQRMEREAILTYNIKTHHPNLTKEQLSNSIMITSPKAIEKLPIPENLDFLQGHWAESDMKKLYSMEIFTDIPHSGMQYEAITRGDFVKALCLAMDIDTSEYESPTVNSPKIFGDVPFDHPLYKYIMGAYDSKLVMGKGSIFDVDKPITREEAFVIYIRVIGLERLGVTNSPKTPFNDDAKISSWAKKEIMAGYKLGIIYGDTNGNVAPQKWISKAEAAAIINRLIDYLRDDISTDYKK